MASQAGVRQHEQHDEENHDGDGGAKAVRYWLPFGRYPLPYASASPMITAPRNVNAKLRNLPIIAAAYALTMRSVSGRCWSPPRSGAMRIPASAASEAADRPRQHRRSIRSRAVQRGQRPIVDGRAHGHPCAGVEQQEAEAAATATATTNENALLPTDRDTEDVERRPLPEARQWMCLLRAPQQQPEAERGGQQADRHTSCTASEVPWSLRMMPTSRSTQGQERSREHEDECEP